MKYFRYAQTTSHGNASIDRGFSPNCQTKMKRKQKLGCIWLNLVIYTTVTNQFGIPPNLIQFKLELCIGDISRCFFHAHESMCACLHECLRELCTLLGLFSPLHRYLFSLNGGGRIMVINSMNSHGKCTIRCAHIQDRQE